MADNSNRILWTRPRLETQGQKPQDQARPEVSRPRPENLASRPPRPNNPGWTPVPVFASWACTLMSDAELMSSSHRSSELTSTSRRCQPLLMNNSWWWLHHILWWTSHSTQSTKCSMWARAVRIDLLHFLARCRKKGLNQALCVLS